MATRLHCDKMTCEYNFSEICKAGAAYNIEGKLSCPYKIRPPEKPESPQELMRSIQTNCNKSNSGWKSNSARRVFK